MLLNTFMVFSQIGIYTEKPLAVFHIDGLSNNKIENENYKDDIAVDVSTDGSLIMSIGGIPNKENPIQLDLAGEKSALLLNKVALNSNTDKSSLLSPLVNGTIVYNTVTNTNIEAGLFYFKDDIFYPLNSRNIVSQIKYLNLAQNCIVKTGSGANDTPSVSEKMIWQDPTVTSSSTSSILLPETASYAFTVRLWGQRPTSNLSSDVRLVIYIWLLNAVTSAILDVAELNIPVPAGVRDYSYSVTLSATVKAGDTVALSVGAPRNSGSTASMNPGTMIADPGSDQNPSRTSVIYWKLQ